MGYGNNAVAHCVCACESYVTMITQLSDLVTLCTLSSLFAGYATTNDSSPTPGIVAP